MAISPPISLQVAVSSMPPTNWLSTSGIVAPVFEAARALALRVSLGLILLREVALAVRNDAAHVVDIVVVISVWILLRVLLQYFYDLAATECKDGDREVKTYQPQDYRDFRVVGDMNLTV